jgi:protein O-GlcNAc transferase
MTAEETFNLAVARHDAGDLAAAENLYRQVLAEQPHHADALHRLGLLAYQVGQYDSALQLISRAIEINPANPDCHCNIGLVLSRLGLLDQAMAAYRRCLELEPLAHEAHHNLGNALREKGALPQAIAAYQHALSLRPDHVASLNNMGTAMRAMGLLPEAIAAYRRSLAIAPDRFATHNNLGNALGELGQLDEAISCFRKAVALGPTSCDAHLNLANALRMNRMFDEAVRVARRALDLSPDRPNGHGHLGLMLMAKGDLDAAADEFREAIRLKPNDFLAYNNLANVLQTQGEIDPAIAMYDRALAIEPAASVASNRLFAMQLRPQHDAHALLREHRLWNQRYGQVSNIPPHANPGAPGPDRRLRIGYVSADFREHVVGWNLAPLLDHHDHKHFEVFCYASVVRPDSLTERFRAKADVWRDIARLDDPSAADLIRSDRIDILVDLAGHTAGNRLLVFVRKPAPVAITYLGYAGTTGLEAINYRLSDPYIDPPESDLGSYSERTIRLPISYWCYQPGGRAPEMEPAPSAANGFVTFGCMNSFAKVSNSALDAWGQIMSRVGGSRLLLNCPQGSARRRIEAYMAGKGISSDRLEFFPQRPWDQYVRTYHRIDVALDTFPYGGGITTCDALWMGVPVVSLFGRTAAGRGGRSILSNVGLPELTADSLDDYVRLAVDCQRWIALKPTLRQKMIGSPLMDAGRFARDVESAYRDVWRRWTGGTREGNQNQP